MFEELLARLIEKVENRYYGKHRGFVSDNQDPDNLGRIKAKVPGLLKDEETGWALPCLPYGGSAEQGFFAIPEVDAGVWIEFEAGDLTHPLWVGTWWGSGEIPESAKPDQKIIKTKSGHTLLLDDTGGSELIKISTPAGHIILLDDTGGSEMIRITDKTEKNEILINSNENTLTIKAEKDITVTAKGDLKIKSEGDLTLEGNNVTLKAKKDGKIETKGCEIKASQKCQIEGTSGVTLKNSAAKVALDGPTVNINSGALEVT